MQAYGHHFRRRGAFRPEPVDGIDAVFREIVAIGETAATLEAHVVGIEGVGQHHMRVPADFPHEGQIVVIGVAVVQKAALLDQQAAGGRTGS